MSYDSWSCLMVENGPGMLDDDVCAALKMAACELNLKKSDRMPIRNDVCDGVIETQWDTHVVGTRSGVLFRTQITCETGDYRVNFLLSTADLERGAAFLREMEELGVHPWGSPSERFPVPALYEFYDLSKPRKKRLN